MLPKIVRIVRNVQIAYRATDREFAGGWDNARAEGGTHFETGLDLIRDILLQIEKGDQGFGGAIETEDKGTSHKSLRSISGFSWRHVLSMEKGG